MAGALLGKRFSDKLFRRHRHGFLPFSPASDKPGARAGKHLLQPYFEGAQRNSEGVDRMNQANPKYVLRNYLAQLALDKVNEGDFSLVKELLEA